MNKRMIPIWAALAVGGLSYFFSKDPSIMWSGAYGIGTLLILEWMGL